MRKLRFKCRLSLGDIVMLTAAVRDLHRCYPGQFITDVHTSCTELWEHNPNLTPLPQADSQVEEIACSYPLINRCNTAPYHCLHGFIDFFNHRLGLAIKPTAFRGDIHLSAQEKLWYSQVHETAGRDIPFWLVAAGGKHDVTIKWWQTERYQQVVDHFRGRIQFVQVGQWGHHHPKLEGAIDLRGQTNLRQLVRLVYHAQGVLCSVTGLMHLAAAVETRTGRPPNRACVVVAGAREPAHWEAYPDHQFIHTNGAVTCAGNGGCWRDRTRRLGDGDHRDQPERLCVDVVNGLPRCMDLIEAAEVIRRIETYFRGGSLKYLGPEDQAAGQRAVRATGRNPYTRQKLNLHSAGLACEGFLNSLTVAPPWIQARGIVCGDAGGPPSRRVLASLWRLRRLGCALPVQFWHLGKTEFNRHTQAALARLAVQCIDARHLRRRFPVRQLHGPQLQPYALLYSPFREALWLGGRYDWPRHPERLFGRRDFRRRGALFWAARRRGKEKRGGEIWRSCGLRRRSEPGLTNEPMLLDKPRCWPALRLALWFTEHADFYLEHLQEPSEVFHLAFRKLRQPWAITGVKSRNGRSRGTSAEKALRSKPS